MEQPVARYTEADLERVLARDFPVEEHESIRAALRTYGTDFSYPEVLRVWMACLKCASGDAAKVVVMVEAAQQDYRDVLAWAEYPRYLLAGDEEERQRAIEDDWAELQAWLQRP